VPSLLNESAWGVPATREDASVVVATIAILVEPSADERRVEAMSSYLARQDYSKAELAYAANELPRDEHLDAKMRYGKPFTPADVERVVSKIRKVRGLLQRKRIPEAELQSIIREVDALTEDDFGVCGRDAQDRPVYTLTADARARIEDATPHE